VASNYLQLIYLCARYLLGVGSLEEALSVKILIEKKALNVEHATNAFHVCILDIEGSQSFCDVIAMQT